MNKKSAVLLTCILCCAMLLSGCSKIGGQKVTILKKTTPTPAASDAAVTPVPTETPDKPKEAAGTNVGVNLKQMEGVYLEEGGKKGMIRLLAKTDKIMRIYVDYPDKAYGEPHWEMTGIYDSSKKELVYSDATMTRKIYKDGKETTETVYTLGTGSFSVSGPKLTWNDDKSENTGIQEVIGNESSFVYEMSLDTYQQKLNASATIKSGNNFTVTPDKPEAISATTVTPAPQALNANSVTPVPTPVPTVTQTPIVTAAPEPAVTQTPVVTAAPTPAPTQAPAATAAPTPAPTQAPAVTAAPTPAPTQTPIVTAAPTPAPTQEPVVTAAPTEAPPEPATYLIVWLDRDGNVLDSQSYSENDPEPETEVIPADMEDDVNTYVFEGWDSGSWDESGTTKTYWAQYDVQPKPTPEPEPVRSKSPEVAPEFSEDPEPEELSYEDSYENEEEDPYEEADGYAEEDPYEETDGDTAEDAGYETGGWIPAADVSEAVAMTGMYFDEISWGAIPEGFSSVDYQYQDGAICANYRNTEGEAGLLIGKTWPGSGVTDDLFSGGRYAGGDMWSLQAGSVTVSCKGSGGLINEASFETDEAHYVIVCEEGEEAGGLSEEELRSLVFAITGESPAENPGEGAAGPEGDYVESPEVLYEEVPEEYAAEPEEYWEEPAEQVYEYPEEVWTEEPTG